MKVKLKIEIKAERLEDIFFNGQFEKCSHSYINYRLSL